MSSQDDRGEETRYIVSRRAVWSTRDVQGVCP